MSALSARPRLKHARPEAGLASLPSHTFLSTPAAVDSSKQSTLTPPMAAKSQPSLNDAAVSCTIPIRPFNFRPRLQPRYRRPSSCVAHISCTPPSASLFSFWFSFFSTRLNMPGFPDLSDQPYTRFNPAIFPLHSVPPISPCRLEYTFLARCQTRTRTRNKPTPNQQHRSVSARPCFPAATPSGWQQEIEREDNRGRSQGTAFKGIIFPNTHTFRLGFPPFSAASCSAVFFSFLPVSPFGSRAALQTIDGHRLLTSRQPKPHFFGSFNTKTERATRVQNQTFLRSTSFHRRVPATIPSTPPAWNSSGRRSRSSFGSLLAIKKGLHFSMQTGVM